jgi:ATP-dependent DNA helicase RecQ
MSYLRRKYNIDSESESDEESYQIDNLVREVISENKILKDISDEKKFTNLKIVKVQSKPDSELLTQYNGLLKKYWGYDELKQTQFEIIKKVIEENKDVCAILATGFGKSICYQLPYLITQKNVIVISPLIALMHEQGQEMLSKGIPTAVFNSDTTAKKKNEEKLEIINGTNKLIFMTPEFFIKSEDFIKLIQNNLAMVCIDEAHAVSTWGLDFRPGYTELKIIKSWIPNVPILTLTATASTKVREDIYKILRLSNPDLVVGNFDRPNLSIKVLPRKDNVIGDIAGLLNKYPDEYVIIYCKTRDETDLLADQISNEIRIKTESYHAGMSDKNRKKVQQDFIDGKVKCMCATIAFGMGINIPGVRLVIHYNCPKNLESYYQEIGRAGRDGKPSECVLFYSAKDFQISRFLIKDMVNPAQKLYQEEQIRQIEKYVYSTVCRRKIILANFGQTIESCSNCDNCIKAKLFKNESVELIDYTCPIYLVLNVLARTNGKFGLGMSLNVLAGKKSKVKDWMVDWDEYGSGISFGNDIWWKELVRYLLNNDYVIETQAQGMFFSTVCLTDKGKELRTKLLTKYPNYLSLLADSANSNSNSTQYKLIQIKLPKLQAGITEKTTKSTKSTKLTKSTGSTKSTDKSKSKDKDPIEKVNKSTCNKKISTKTNKSNSNEISTIDFKSIGVGSVRTKLSQILNSDSDSDSD